MAIAENRLLHHPSGSDDPLYHSGMAALQRGEWQEALGCFETLVERYPESRHIQQVRKETQLRARLDEAGLPKERRLPALLRAVPWRPLILLTAAIVILHSGLILAREARALTTDSQLGHYQAQLLADARALSKAGDLAAAEKPYREILAVDPIHQVARQELAWVVEQRELSALYEEAVGLQEGRKYEEALAAFQALGERAAGYRDVSQRIAVVEHHRDLFDLLGEAGARYYNGKTLEAISYYEKIRSRDRDYETALVAGRLSELYVRAGRDLIAHDAPLLDELSKALEYFTSALVLQPNQEEAEVEQRLAKGFLEAQPLIEAQQWDEVIAKLRPLYEARPDYLGGNPVNQLYNAYVHRADRYRQAEAWVEAHALYEAAHALPVPDSSVALQGIEATGPHLPSEEPPASSPTSTPTLEAAVVAQPQAAAPAAPVAQPSPPRPIRAVPHFIWPTGGRISQGYHASHGAIDIAVPTNTPIYASQSGQVVFAGWDTSGYGYNVVIDHHNGWFTRYAHLAGIYPAHGVWVQQGELIGLSGSTGHSTGPHLHFEISTNGYLYNPLDYLPR